MKTRQVSEFKETEIGKIPADWDVKKISEIDTTKTCVQTGPFGSLLHSYDYQEKGHPLILVKHVKDGQIIEEDLPKIGEKKYSELLKFILKEGDIIFTRVGYVGNTAYVEEKHNGWLFSGQTLRIRIDNQLINNRFISYFFLTKNFKNIASSVVLGSTRDSINTQILKNIPIPIPPKDEQDKIVSIIGPLIKKIQYLEQQNMILEKIIQSIFKSWFIDFDGISEFDNSEIGEIPKGWIVVKIKNICNTFGGGTPSTTNEEYWGGEIDWATPTDLSKLKNTYLETTERKITKKGLENCSSKLHPPNSILMTSRAGIGFFAINSVPVATNQGFIVIQTKNKHDLFYLFNNFKNRVSEFINNANGTTFLEISRGTFRELNILYPPIPIIINFDKIVSSKYEKIKNNELSIKILTNIRDFLLPKLMLGEIRA